MQDLSNIETEKVLLYCTNCYIFTLNFHKDSKNCKDCGTRMQKLSSLYTQVKLILHERLVESGNKKDYNAIKQCVKQCQKQFLRCENCLLWEHQLETTALKCLCNKE